jgi:solute carrier family 29 (equilibrative nucleoside transporter), member 1/2/3
MSKPLIFRFKSFSGDLTKRVVWSLIIEIVIFLITVILAMVDSSSWNPATFFWSTMISVVILNMAGGIFQNTAYGMAAKLPSKYTGAVVLGSNISGTFASVISILSGSIWSSVRKAAIYYFITAMFVILLCFDTYFAMPLNKFYRYHEIMSEKQQEKSRRAGININARPPYWTIFKQSFMQLFNVFFIFFVTLTVFPNVHSDIKMKNKNEMFMGIVSEDLFTPITCFLTFNVFAMLGSLTTSWIKWPSPRFLIWPVVLRAAFIPLFLFCNYQPLSVTRVLPVYITNDYIYWGIAIIMSYSSGYLSSLAMMYAPGSQTNPQYQITAGMFAAAMLITGIFSGILFSSVFPQIVQLTLNI